MSQFLREALHLVHVALTFIGGGGVLAFIGWLYKRRQENFEEKVLLWRTAAASMAVPSFHLVDSCRCIRFSKEHFGTGVDPVILPRNRRVTKWGAFSVSRVSRVM
jgi:hypothetical protein